MRSTMATLRYLRTLSPDQRDVLAKKKIDGEFTAVQLLALLRPLAEFDGMNDRARGKTIWIIVLLVAAAFATLFFVVEISAVVGWVVIGALLATVAVLIAVEVRLGKLDVSNNVRQIALPFLAVLREDTPRDSQLQVHIDLTKAMHPSKRKERKAPYKRGRYHKIVDTLYHDPWFGGSAQLADGSRLRWEVEDDVVHSQCSKRNARGKHKTKSKYAKRSLLHATVSLPLRNYQFGDIGKVQGTRSAVNANDKRTVVKLSRKLKSRSLEPFHVSELVNLVSVAYRPVLPANREAAQ